VKSEFRQPAKRFRKRVEVRYGVEQPQFTGYSGNISRTGMMLRTIRVFAPGTLLVLELKFPDKTIVARGHVSWAREGSVQLLPTGRVGMGIKFVDPPDELHAIVEGGAAI
jgi:uncharacterized protein (TIGR02266 family)